MTPTAHSARVYASRPTMLAGVVVASVCVLSGACSSGDLGADAGEAPTTTSVTDPAPEPPATTVVIDRPERVEPTARTGVPTDASHRILSGLDKFRFADLSPDGRFVAQTSENGICVLDLDTLTTSCGGIPSENGRPSWAPDSSRLLVDDHLIPAPLVLHEVGQDGAVDGGTTLDDHQFLAWDASDTLVARVDGFLARVDLATGETARIGEVGTPFDAVVAGDWLWYSAAGEVTAMHTTGFVQRFSVDDRFAFRSVDSTGQVVLASIESAGAELIVFDALDGTEATLPPISPDDRAYAGLLSPDGALVLRTAETGDREHALHVLEVATLASGGGWTELPAVLPGPLSSIVVWLDATSFRASLFDSVVEVRLAVD